jgi:hypothetical protein
MIPSIAVSQLLGLQVCATVPTTIANLHGGKVKAVAGDHDGELIAGEGW